MPAPDKLLKLHERLLAGDPTASSELAEAVFDSLVEGLRSRNPTIEDETLIADAATDALIDYLKNPASFRPEMARLRGYLEMAAQGDLKNALAKRSRRRAKEEPFEEVDVRPVGGNKYTEAPDVVTRMDTAEIRLRVEQLFDDPRDRQIADLVIDGERSTEAFAKALGLEALPSQAQRREVKRHKDRIKKRLRQLGERIRDERNEGG